MSHLKSGIAVIGIDIGKNSFHLVGAQYQEKLRVKHLAMKPSLQGTAISFRLENHSIKIRLPTFSPDTKWSEYVEAEADSWDKDGNILAVHIYAILVIIEDPTFSIPTTAAQHRHVNTSLFTLTEAQALDEQSDALYLLARRAFDLFIRVARWKTGMALLDVDDRSDGPSHDGGRLFNLAHGGAFYSPRIPRVVVVPRRTNLTPQIWQSIGDALANGDLPPIWNEYLASAERRIKVSDLREAIIDRAIGAEAVIRQFPRVSVTRRNKRLSEIFDNWDHFGFPLAGPWFSDLRTLIRVRNTIMHTGTDQRLNLI